MNSMLDKCGSFAVLVSLWTILPVEASATKRSIENTLRVDRNASQRPSGLNAGPTFRSPPRPVPLMTSRPVSFGGVVDASGGGQHLRDDVVAEAAAHVRPERLAPAIREVLRLVEILDRRQRVFA